MWEHTCRLCPGLDMLEGLDCDKARLLFFPTWKTPWTPPSDTEVATEKPSDAACCQGRGLGQYYTSHSLDYSGWVLPTYTAGKGQQFMGIWRYTSPREKKHYGSSSNVHTTGKACLSSSGAHKPMHLGQVQATLFLALAPLVVAGLSG